jgi:hypothetical protein
MAYIHYGHPTMTYDEIKAHNRSEGAKAAAKTRAQTKLMKNYIAKFGWFGGCIWDDKLFRQLAKALKTGTDIPELVERRREHEKWRAKQQRALEKDMRLHPENYIDEPEPELTAEEQAELDAHAAEHALRSTLKTELGHEVNAARNLAAKTRDVRVTGGQAYDEYREAVERFITAHKSANRAWKAFNKVRLPEERRPLIAYHEAGHAVIGRVLGVPIRHASIEPKDLGCEGHVTRVDIGRKLTKFSETDVIWTMAGYIAERKFTGKPSDGGRGDDAFIRYHTAQYISKPKLRTARNNLRARTAELVEEHWNAIHEVALELLRVGTISGDRIDEVIDYAPLLW